MVKTKWILTFLWLGLLSSCVTSKKVNLLQEPDKTIPSYADTLSFEDYVIRKGDRLYVHVYSVDEQVKKLFDASGANSGGTNSSWVRQNTTGNQNSNTDLYTYLVLDDGTIDFPLVGKLSVRGLTTRDVKHRLEEELSSYIKDYGDYHIVSCEVNVVQRSYSVISQAGTGVFPIQREKITIFEALAQAGDVGDWSDRSKVKIVREIEGKTTVITFDLRSKDIIHSEYYYVEPNDVIYVQKLKGQAVGINSAATGVAIVATTLSFGGFIYAIVVRAINAAKSK